MSKPTDIQQQLRDAIQASGQSLNQLAQASGVDSGRLSRFMRGQRDLTLEGVSRLCQVLGLKFCPSDTGTSANAAPTDQPAAKKGKGRK
jgi:transcriptional regulator with XRE-family HTH domain